jgi:flavin reductase (DIM6/NTAB) family NADH-FMN oxidoreductase RutF
MIGVQSNSGTHDTIEGSGALAVNFLAEDQQEIAQKFFRPPEDAAEGRLHGLRYEPGPETGSPILVDLPAWLEARVIDRVARGDHTVYVCEVVEAGSRRPDFAPLLLANTPWSYGG